MTTDYDTPRHQGEVEDGNELVDDPDVQHVIKARHAARDADTDTAAPAAAADPVGDDAASADGLAIEVIPARVDEFTCSRCHLVQHRSQLAASAIDHQVCRDCI